MQNLSFKKYGVRILILVLCLGSSWYFFPSLFNSQQARNKIESVKVESNAIPEVQVSPEIKEASDKIAALDKPIQSSSGNAVENRSIASISEKNELSPTANEPKVGGPFPSKQSSTPSASPALITMKSPSSSQGASQEKPSAQEKASGSIKSIEKRVVSAEGCFTVSFIHQKMASHADGEACLKHNNLLSLKSALNQAGVIGSVNPDTVCISVNGSAVKHTKVKDDEFLFGPVAGPNSVVTARFCTGKSKCAEKCIIKQDEFMNAIGADNAETNSAVGWDGGKEISKEESEVESEAAALGKDKEQADQKNEIFSGWVTQASKAACGTNTFVGERIVSIVRKE